MKAITKILILDKNSKILVLVRGDTHPKFAGHLDFPGGEVEPGENSLKAIIREVKEEIDLDFNHEDVKLLFDSNINDYLAHSLYSYKLGEIEPKITISWEHSSYMWVDKDQLIAGKLPENVDPYYRDVINYLKAIKDYE